jgi:hypothetical protein
MRWTKTKSEVGYSSYLTASNNVPQRRQRYWSVIACVPKSEMT